MHLIVFLRRLASDFVSDDDSRSIPVRSPRPVRNRTAPDRYTYGHNQMASTPKKSVKFDDEKQFELETRYNLMTLDQPSPDDSLEYTHTDAMLIARLMTGANEGNWKSANEFAQQYIYKQGLKKFGDRGREAGHVEMKQLHDRECFTPVDVSTLTPTEKKRAVEALMFLTEKRNGTIKGRMVYNGKPTREWLGREESSSPTAAAESIMLTAVIDAHEGRDVMTADVANGFIQAKMPETKPGQDRVVMKITGVLVELLVEMAPHVYEGFVVYENGQKVLYVEVLRGLYGMLIAVLLWYKRFRGDLENDGWKFNPYDPCVCNKVAYGKQHTLVYWVDDLKASCVVAKANDDLLKWLNLMYGEFGAVKATRGKVHDFLGMTFDYSVPGKVKVDMIDYMKSMLEEFPVKFEPGESAESAAAEDLFSVTDADPLPKDDADTYHHFVAQGLWACKRARPDIQPAIVVMCTRVKAPNQGDWKKLVRLMRFINGTVEDKLTLSADNLHVIHWYVDSAFGVHPDFRGHTGAIMTYGTGAIQSISSKQKLNTRSSTESELVGTDSVCPMVLWTKLFVEAQGYKIDKNLVWQDGRTTRARCCSLTMVSGARVSVLDTLTFVISSSRTGSNVAI